MYFFYHILPKKNQKISKYISNKKGGDGCARDIIEQVLRCQGNWFDKDAHTW